MTDKFKENNQEFSEEENEINENENSEEIKIARAKIPRGEEVIGIIEERLGGNKMKVKCLDGKTRILVFLED